jgi:hypothetical protein
MALSSLRFFRLELSVVIAVVLLYMQYRDRYANWPRFRTLVRFFFILIFAEIGVGGLRAAIKLIFGTSSFVETFRQPNILFFSPNLMCWLAGAYALAGTVFFVSVMFLGQMSEKGRRVFFALVGPCTLLYPAIMVNLTQTSGVILEHSIWMSAAIFMMFAALHVRV